MTDDDGTVNRVWRVDDPAVHAAVTELLADAELLIADGHHRYETARAYRDEVGGEGPQNYTLMALTGLDDPGLTVFPTHRLLSGFAADPERQRAPRRRPARALRGRARSPLEELDPAGEEGVGVFGFYDAFHKQALPAAACATRPSSTGCSPASPRPTAASTRRSSRRWS